MRGVLFDEAGANSPVSPLVDIVFNAMAAVFLILMIYLVVARPLQEEALEITTMSLPEAVWYNVFESGIHASGGTPPYRFEISGNLPAWLTFEPDSGRLAGNPRPSPANDTDPSQPYQTEVTIAVKDARNETANKTFQFSILPSSYPFDAQEHPLNLMTDALPPGYLNSPYRIALAPTGGIEPYRLQISRGELPPGLTLDSYTITGIPSVAGSYTFDVEIGDQQIQYGVVTEAEAITAGKTYTLEIQSVSPPQLRDALPMGRVGQSFNGVIAPEYGRAPYQFQIDGDLPPGLTATRGVIGQEQALEQDALHAGASVVRISGTPEAEGSTEVAINVQDADQNSVTGRFVINVMPALPDLNIDGTLPSARVGEAYAAQLSISGAVPPVRWKIEGDLGNGMGTDGKRVTGVPQQQGTTGLTFIVQDAQGRQARKTVELRVLPPRKTMRLRRLDNAQ